MRKTKRRKICDCQRYKNGLQNYNSEHASLLPRMWSAEHAENYMIYAGFLEFSIKPEYQMQNDLRSLVQYSKIL